jgi:hypothetical protein
MVLTKMRQHLLVVLIRLGVLTSGTLAGTGIFWAELRHDVIVPSRIQSARAAFNPSVGTRPVGSRSSAIAIACPDSR